MTIDQIFNYLNDNWLVISMVYFPAFIGYMNAFIAAARVMGWTQLADYFGKLEKAIQVFVDTARSRREISKEEPK
jgi:hypothetical protein